MLLAPGADSEAQKPTWDAYNPDQVRKKVDLSALRAQQAQEQSTYFDISPNAPGAGGAQDSTYFDIGACARPPLSLSPSVSPSAAPSAAPSACVFSRAGRARSPSVHVPCICPARAIVPGRGALRAHECVPTPAAARCTATAHRAASGGVAPWRPRAQGSYWSVTPPHMHARVLHVPSLLGIA